MALIYLFDARYVAVTDLAHVFCSRSRATHLIKLVDGEGLVGPPTPPELRVMKKYVPSVPETDELELYVGPPTPPALRPVSAGDRSNVA
jgi:hypothetical protein